MGTIFHIFTGNAILVNPNLPNMLRNTSHGAYRVSFYTSSWGRKNSPCRMVKQSSPRLKPSHTSHFSTVRGPKSPIVMRLRHPLSDRKIGMPAGRKSKISIVQMSELYDAVYLAKNAGIQKPY